MIKSKNMVKNVLVKCVLNSVFVCEFPFNSMRVGQASNLIMANPNTFNGLVLDACQEFKSHAMFIRFPYFSSSPSSFFLLLLLIILFLLIIQKTLFLFGTCSSFSNDFFSLVILIID